MKVHIEDQLYLESDGMQFILKEYSGKVYTDKTGKETESYTTHGYFSSVQGAIKHIIKMKIMQSTAGTLGELLKELKRIETFVENQVLI